MNDAVQRCAECGSELPRGTPLGMCPNCALKGALELSEDDSTLPTLALPAPEAGERIGRYKLLEKIGEGGCGVVYMAEQEEPVRRRVALKVIKPGMDTHEVIARFEAERQALALMEHPHIAKIFDAGATAAGRPYFVMELVRGLRITDYCDQKLLSTRQRLDLFMQVCQAVQHAHQKGIIHRDLKPSNILVTVNDGVPVPKVIDFGIAKATGQALTDKTFFTKFQQLIGTPTYMSPEQAEMTSLDIDTRSDIYSLGVLLYELLTGRTPFDTKELLQAGVEEMLRTIREQEPVRPSARLSTLDDDEQTTVAQQRQTHAPKLIHLVCGDLDWIVMKCLEKDRARRYETANGLAMDLQRHLDQEPVTARPPTATYRLRKFVRRNNLAVGAVTVVLAAVLTGFTISTLLFVKERDARRRAAAAELEQTRLNVQLANLLTQREGQGGGVWSVQFNPDGTRIVTSSSNKTVQVWDAYMEDLLERLRKESIIRRYFEEWANRGNAAVADEFIATNLMLRNPPAVFRNLEDYKTDMAKFHAAFPDARYTIDDQIAKGDKVVVRWTLRATQATEYQGHPPNGKTMTVTGISIFRLVGGKIQEITVSMDRLGQMEQLGWLPARPQPSIK